MKAPSFWPRFSPAAGVDAVADLASVLTILVVAGLMISRPYPIVPETDIAAYFQMAKAFHAGEWPAWADDPFRFNGHPYVTTGDGRVMVKYLPGYPLLLALGYWLGGSPDAALWVNAALGLIMLLAFWRLARHLFDPVTAWACTLILVTAPITYFFMVYPLTHSADLCFSVLAMLFAVRYGKRRRILDAALLGLTAGVLPLTRPTNLLLWPAIWLMYHVARRHADGLGQDRNLAETHRYWRHHLLKTRERLLGWLANWRQDPRQALAALRPSPAQWALAGAFLLPLLALGYYDWRSFGVPWRTGYWFSGEQTAFEFTWAHLTTQFGRLVAGRDVLLADGVLVLMVLGLTRRGFRRLFFVWVAPTVLAYTAYYYYAWGTPYIRFFLVALPAAVLAGGNFLHHWFKSPAAKLLLLVLGLGVAAPPLGHCWQVLAESGKPGGANWDWAAGSVLKPLNGESLPGLARLIRERFNPAERPVTVFAGDRACWHTGSLLGVTAYDLGAWQPPEQDPPVTLGTPRGQASRAEAFAALRRQLGPEGLARNFRDQVRAQLAAGRAVLVLTAPDYGPPVEEWLRADRQFTLASVGSYPEEFGGRRGYRTRQFTVWQVTLQPE